MPRMHRDPMEQDWGPSTVEVYNAGRSVALHVFNHDLSSEDAVARTLRFCVGRVLWFRKQLPEGSTQEARFDDRGQFLQAGTRERIKRALATLAVAVTFASERT